MNAAAVRPCWSSRPQTRNTSGYFRSVTKVFVEAGEMETTPAW